MQFDDPLGDWRTEPAAHFLTQEKPARVNALVLDFLTNEPVPTVAAIRRAQAA